MMIDPVASIILAAQLTSLGYVIVGMILCTIGVMLIAYTSGIPILNFITTFIGWTLIVVGGAVGLYGISPEIASFAYGAGFVTIWLVGVIIIIIYQIRLIRR